MGFFRVFWFLTQRSILTKSKMTQITIMLKAALDSVNDMV